MFMSQINVNPDDRGEVNPHDRGERRSDGRGALTEASRNLTWAIGAVIVIAALAFATVWVVQHLHPV
jgi:hypothetical protein